MTVTHRHLNQLLDLNSVRFVKQTERQGEDSKKKAEEERWGISVRWAGVTKGGKEMIRGITEARGEKYTTCHQCILIKESLLFDHFRFVMPY